eukprot:TRINITY_DN3831_c0_g1_i1.p1 TRINITY_DN3831_c0_g1~~TRINITY_DN3831_c0_g1_i1.p1  ORF type:complete len:488 (-),score=141.49 TRINITY_DN3831_c0_g1_i1:143-1606(-)
MSTVTPANVAAKFRSLGITVTVKAARLLCAQAAANNNAGLVDDIVEMLHKDPPSVKVVDEKAAAEWVSRVRRDPEAVRTRVLVVFSAKEFPKYTFNTARSCFEKVTAPLSMSGNANDKMTVMRERFFMVHQRVARSKLFLRDANDRPELSRIESLCGSTGSKVVLGVLSTTQNGYVLEDPNAFVPIDISSAKILDGMFTEGSIVLAEGYLEDGVFRATLLAQPPAESRTASLQALGGTADLFGGMPTPEITLLLNQYEEEHSDAQMFFFSEFQLDCPQVLERFDVVLKGYADMPPELIVLMGNFCSKPCGAASVQAAFGALGDTLRRYPKIVATTTFVFVPGPNDPCGNPWPSLPQPPLPRFMVQPLLDSLLDARVFFVTNPARIRYCNHEIVVFREDLSSKMRRSLLLPTATNQLTKHVQKELERARKSPYRKTAACRHHLQPITPVPTAAAGATAALVLRLRSAPLPAAALCRCRRLLCAVLRDA